jgi:hypothetical protein
VVVPSPPHQMHDENPERHWHSASGDDELDCRPHELMELGSLLVNVDVAYLDSV